MTSLGVIISSKILETKGMNLLLATATFTKAKS
jgi:hypothetical protein